MADTPGSEASKRIVDALRYVGPGLILTAGIVGTGELVLTPRVAAEHGFTLLWLILLGCIVKVFVQVELGRYSVATGLTTLRAARYAPRPALPRLWSLFLWLSAASLTAVGLWQLFEEIRKRFV